MRHGSRHLLHLAVTLLVVTGVSFDVAYAEETWICWSATYVDPLSLQEKTVTRCRIDGEIRDYEEAVSSLPVVLSPMVGLDANGSCWYWTSRDSNWVLIGFDADGNAVLGYDPDGDGVAPFAVEAIEPICTNEPIEIPSASEEAYQVLASYVHPQPDVLVNPPPGRGVTGMETFVELTPPPPWSDTLVSPVSGRLIEVETWVEAVEIDWGDGTVVVVPAEAIHLLTGYSDGIEPHVYEVKTCEEPGGARCHPTLDAYPIEIRYIWSARFRIDDGAWQLLSVDPTVTRIDYPVAEIIGVVTDTS